jgi:predicted Holliday junction resolvase-like endonuclease
MIHKGKSILTGLAVVMLVLVIVNILLSLGNQYLRLDVNERQQSITQALQLEAVHREIATAIATVAVKTKDEQLKSLLASQGINLSANPEQPANTK